MGSVAGSATAAASRLGDNVWAASGGRKLGPLTHGCCCPKRVVAANLLRQWQLQKILQPNFGEQLVKQLFVYGVGIAVESAIV
jgi:hypothetical protein